MTSAEIRQSFLDFFRSKQHTIVASAPLLPSSPNLLFTNAGMNQFVPIFLGDLACPYKPGRAADTQKCIRAGGKHNDLEDVGFDTYHHTFFEMLGNWSFGDYFKKESIEWGWELLTQVWGMPPKRLFATVYSPAPGDPATFDTDAHAVWSALFRKAGLDPDVHIVNGGRKDNFWMMGDTGPCGPCSEIHFNLLPSDDEAAGRSLVNAGSPRCIEIWNHVFIQFNANKDGSFSPLAARHVDTGMGFERVAGIHATTNGFSDFSAEPSNYNADVFTDLFAVITKLSGRHYGRTVRATREGLSEQEQTDVAFRVLADHARCICCAIADGILPGNEGRNYVIRRILRRGILYGRKINLQPGFFEQLAAPVVKSLGATFPELVQQQDIICRVIRAEEESFGRTLDRGLAEFNHVVAAAGKGHTIPAAAAFKLYDTYGFPPDMTQLLAAERGMHVDVAGFNHLMDEQRGRGRSAHKKEVVVAATDDGSAAHAPTEFTGYSMESARRSTGTVTDVVTTDDGTFLVFDRSPFYAEMGGQAGDHGAVKIKNVTYAVLDTVKDRFGRHLHRLAPACAADIAMHHVIGEHAIFAVSLSNRMAVSRHHSAVHLLHWALRKVLGTHVRQAGTVKTKHRARFDFSHFEQVKPDQLHEVERLVNLKVIENSKVKCYETEFDKKPEDTLAFFGEKYGKIVRVVDIGGYSRELCGGTHVSATGQIGLVKIVSECAIAAGTRRIEIVAGQPAYDFVADEEHALNLAASRLNAGTPDFVQRLETLIARQAELEKELKSFRQKAEAGLAGDLSASAVEKDGLKWVRARADNDDPNALRTLGAQVLAKLGEGVVILGSASGEKATVVALCSPAAVKAGHQAGKIVSGLCAQLGGKGGGKPDFAMGGGRDASKLDEALRG